MTASSVLVLAFDQKDPTICLQAKSAPSDPTGDPRFRWTSQRIRCVLAWDCSRRVVIASPRAARLQIVDSVGNHPFVQLILDSFPPRFPSLSGVRVRTATVAYSKAYYCSRMEIRFYSAKISPQTSRIRATRRTALPSSSAPTLPFGSQNRSRRPANSAARRSRNVHADVARPAAPVPVRFLDFGSRFRPRSRRW